MPEMKQDRVAFDKQASARRVDEDGHLHVETSAISKANVCPYYGREIPDFERLGLAPDRIYQLLRHPDELEKAASTFNGKPLLSDHKQQSAEARDADLTVGNVSNVRYEHPYLKGGLTVWDSEAISNIADSSKRELSSSYRYDADMTPGEYEGVKYDGVMRNIRGNHVALVKAGRAGSDVVVGDQALQPRKGLFYMPKTPSRGLSRKGLLASGALRTYLAPRLASDAQIDLGAMLKDVTAANWKSGKPALVGKLTKATEGKLAKDASLDDVTNMLDALDDVADEVADVLEDPTPVKEEDRATDDDPNTELLDFLASKLSEEDMAQVMEMMKPEPVTEDADPKDAKNMPSPKLADKPISKTAMDAAIAAASAKATRDTMARMREIATAEREVAPYVGALAVAMDSASEVYATALTTLGVDVTGVNDLAALKLVLQAQPKPGEQRRSSTKPLAADAGLAAAYVQKFPDANRLKNS